MKNLSDEQLVDLLRQDNNLAFRELFNRYYSRLIYYALRFVDDWDTAEELIQELFVHFWEVRKELDLHSSFKSYVFRSVHNHALNFLKHKKIERNYVALKESEELSQALKFSDTLIISNLKRKIDEAIDELPPKRKEIFTLSRYKGLKYREIADEMNISVKTVEAQMAKALEYLRKKLADYL